MAIARSAIVGSLDALPYGCVAGTVTVVATRTGGTGLSPTGMGAVVGLVVFSLLAAISVARHRADGTSFVVTRTVVDASFTWP